MAFADFDAILSRAKRALKPPERLSLSEWADRHFRLSSETAAEPGRWKTLPYQREIMDSITDPEVEQVSLMKSARIGYTLMMSAAIGYFIEHEPSSILVVQPTVDDAKGFSKETIAPMLRDVPVLSRTALRSREERAPGPKDSSNTIQHKTFPGGVLSLVGANSGTGFRRISRRVVMFDEVDAYPPSAGSEGDPVRLGMKRSQAFWNRKAILGSTPLTAGTSRIEEAFERGDQRRFHVPCPHCDHFDFLTFSEREDGRGHVMRWPEDEPEAAYFECGGCHEAIEHRDKRAIVERGRWVADNHDAPRGHRSFHIWAAYGYSPNSTWGHIAKEFLEAKEAGPLKLKTFINTVLGETWQDRGEAPEWERLYHRREHYPIGTVPDGVLFLTCGVDVQKDRFVFEVVGWGEGKESWSIDAGAVYVDTSNSKAARAELDGLLARVFVGEDGVRHPVQRLAIDSGYNTQEVYNWARRHPISRVMACKGVSGAKALLGLPSPVDIDSRGRRLRRSYKVWPVGVDVAKKELYGWLKLDHPEGGEGFPPGWCHFPEYADSYFKELTAEHLVEVRKKTGHVHHQWQVLPGRENHFLDCRILARAAAAAAGIDRARKPARKKPAQDEPVQAERDGSWLQDGKRRRSGRTGKSWLKRRR